LLDATTSTLQELNEILLRDTHHFVALLLEIQTLAAAAANTEKSLTSHNYLVLKHIVNR